jgi:hypothetical protein
VKRALFTILTVLIGVVVVGGSVLWLNRIQAEPATLAATLTGETIQTPKGALPHAKLELSVYPQPGSIPGPPQGVPILNQKDGWPFWWPSTSLELPANTVITMTVKQYDSSTTVWNPYWADVHGTLDGTATYNGEKKTGIKPADVAHTFTIHQYPEDTQETFFVSVPMLAVGNNAKNEANGYPKANEITFSFITPGPGEYIWNCEDPCGQGYQDFGGVMSERGWMSGTVTVV